MIQEFSAGAIIFSKKIPRKYLIIQSTTWKTWGFAKGKIEAGETEQQAAVREVYEETGTRGILLPKFRDEQKYEYVHKEQHYQKKVTLFLLETETTTIQLHQTEHKNFHWGLYKDCKQLLTHDIDKQALAKAEGYLNNELYT